MNSDKALVILRSVVHPQFFFRALVVYIYLMFPSLGSADPQFSSDTIARFEVDFERRTLWYSTSKLFSDSKTDGSIWLRWEDGEEVEKSTTLNQIWKLSSSDRVVCYRPPGRYHLNDLYYISEKGQKLCVENGDSNSTIPHAAIYLDRPNAKTRLAQAGVSDWFALNVKPYGKKPWQLAIYHWDDIQKCIENPAWPFNHLRANICDPDCAEENCPLSRHYKVQSGHSRYLVREHFEADIGLHPESKALRVVYQSGIPEEKRKTVDETLRLVEIPANEHPAPIEDFEEKRDLSNRKHVEIGEMDQQFSKGWKGHPRFSPNGKWFAYLATKKEHDESAETELLVIPADQPTIEQMGNSRSVNITTLINRPVTNFQWSCNSQCILFQVSSQGDTPLYQANLIKEQWDKPTLNRPIVSGVPAIAQFEASDDGLELLVLASSLSEPPSLVRLARNGKWSTGRFHCNSQTTDQQCKRIAETLRASESVVEHQKRSVPQEKPSGHSVDYFVVSNQSCTVINRCPVVLRVHGGPNGVWLSAYDPITYALAQAGYVVILPNPTGSIGFGQAFTDAVKKQWGGAVVDDVISVMNNVTDLPFVDKNRIYGMGSSYGGYMMNYFLVDGQSEAGIQPNFNFNALVSINGVWDLKEFACETDQPWFPYDQLGIAAGDPACAPNAPSKRLDFNPVDRKKNLLSVPTLVIYSIDDKRVPPEKQNIALGKFLEDQPNAELFRTRELPGGHRLLNSEWKTVLKESLEHFKAHR